MVIEESPRRAARRTWAWAILGIAVSLVAIGLYAAHVWSSADLSKLTEKDTIVLADFTNTTGDSVFDDALKQALAVALTQSPFLNVASDMQVSEILRRMGRAQRSSDPRRREGGLFSFGGQGDIGRLYF